MYTGGGRARAGRRAIAALLQIPERLPSRVRGRIEFVELAGVTHFYAEDRLTFAATLAGKSHGIDASITDLETRLDPEKWLRIHRSTLVQLPVAQEVHGFFGGRRGVRVAALKSKLEL